MTQEEIVQAISDDKTMPFIQPEQLAQIVAFVIRNYRPSLPSNLGEAAKKWKEENFRREYYQIPKDAMSCSFKAGAEWMAGQGIKLHGRILPGTRCNLYIQSDCFDRGFGGLNYKFSDSNDVDMFVQIREKQ